MNVAGVVSLVSIVGWFPTCGVIGWLFSRKAKKRMAKVVWIDQPNIGHELCMNISAMHRDPVAPAPLHVHIIDMERGEITVTDAGGVHAHCAIAGCKESFYISPNLAQLYVVAGAEVRG